MLVDVRDSDRNGGDHGQGKSVMAMQNSEFSLDALLEALANRVAAKLRAGVASDDYSNGTIRPRLLTVEQAGVRIGRTKEAVQHMVAEGRLPVVRDGRRVFLDVEDLDRWIEANKEPGRG